MIITMNDACISKNAHNFVEKLPASHKLQYNIYFCSASHDLK